VADTKQRLLDGALLAVRRHGIAGASARTIAAAAGVNQALVFYHYGSVDELLAAACLSATRDRVSVWSNEFRSVANLRELLDLGRRLHAKERRHGNVSVLAQFLAGAQTDPRLAEATRAALALWTTEIEDVLRRTLANSPLAQIANIPALAGAISAAFVGIELYEGVDAAGAQRAFDALDEMAGLLELVDELGPIATRALRGKVTKVAKTRR